MSLIVDCCVLSLFPLIQFGNFRVSIFQLFSCFSLCSSSLKPFVNFVFLFRYKGVPVSLLRLNLSDIKWVWLLRCVSYTLIRKFSGNSLLTISFSGVLVFYLQLSASSYSVRHLICQLKFLFSFNCVFLILPSTNTNSFPLSQFTNAVAFLDPNVASSQARVLELVEWCFCPENSQIWEQEWHYQLWHHFAFAGWSGGLAFACQLLVVFGRGHGGSRLIQTAVHPVGARHYQPWLVWWNSWHWLWNEQWYDLARCHGLVVYHSRGWSFWHIFLDGDFQRSGFLFVYCHASNVILTPPENGTMEQVRGKLPGGHNQGHKENRCHGVNMPDPAR